MPALETVLNLNNDKFNQEFAEAAAVVGKYAKSIEAQFERNFSRAQTNLQALRLEAAGHREAADALRQKVSIEDQAEQLAKSAGISQQEAVRMTRERVALEQKLATNSREFHSEEKRGLLSSLDRWKQVAAAVGGFFAIRATFRGVGNLAQEIDELGKTATRLRLPTEEVQVLSQVAKDGGSDLESLVKALNRAQVAATEASRGTATYTREFEQLNINVSSFQQLNPQERLKVLADAYVNAANKGDAFTAVTRIMGRSVSDLIPVLEAGGAGVEKMAERVRTLDEKSVRNVERLNDEVDLLATNIKTSLLQSILNLEGPITRVFGRFAQDLEASLDLLTDSANGLGKGDDIYAALEALREITAMGGEGAARTDDKYKVLLARFGEMNETLKEQARLMLENEKVAGFVARGLLSAAEAEPIYQTIRDEWERIAEATEWAAKEEGERVAQAQLTAEALEEQERQMKKMMGDEDSLRKKLAERLEASKSLEEQIATAREEGRRILKDNRAESFDDLQKKLAGAETTSEQVAILKDTERLFQLMEKINKLSEENAGDREKADAIKQQAEESQKRYATEMEILRATLDGDQSKLDSIDRARRIEEEILRLKKEQLNITDKEAARLATAKADAQDAIRERAGEKDTAKKRASEIKLGQEMEVLRLRAAGREKEAEALKKEFEARAEAIRLAEQTNMTEEKALAFVRQRQQLESQIERNKATGENTAAGRRPRSRIYKKDGPSGADSRLGAETTAWGTKLWRADLRPGLGPVAVDRAREARPRDPNEAVRKAATDYYQKNLQQNEELLNIWRTLGVA